MDEIEFTRIANTCYGLMKYEDILIREKEEKCTKFNNMLGETLARKDYKSELVKNEGNFIIELNANDTVYNKLIAMCKELDGNINVLKKWLCGNGILSGKTKEV